MASARTTDGDRPPSFVRGAILLLLVTAGLFTGHTWALAAAWLLDRLLPIPARVTRLLMSSWVVFIAITAWLVFRWFAAGPASDVRLQAASPGVIFAGPAAAWPLIAAGRARR